MRMLVNNLQRQKTILILTHERSFNEHCILHVRIPFFNGINVFL